MFFQRTSRLRGESCAEILKECLSKRMFHLNTVHVYGICDCEVMLLSGHRTVDSLHEEVLMAGEMKIDVVRTLIGHSKHLKELLVIVDTYKDSAYFVSESHMIETTANLLQKFKKASPLVHILVSCEIAESVFWGATGGRYPFRKRLEI